MAKPTRSVTFPLRLSPAEKAILEERAAAAGLKVSEYLRREAGIGRFGRADLRRAGLTPEAAGKKQTGRADLNQPGGPGQLEPAHQDLEQQVAKLAQRMPRRNAEGLARRELAREAARKAIKG